MGQEDYVDRWRVYDVHEIINHFDDNIDVNMYMQNREVQVLYKYAQLQ